jgi:hypothetical protein
MTDFRALCAELVNELEEWIGYGDEADCADAHAVVDRARAALAEQPVGPTLMERALAGDATAAKQFLHEAGFTDKHGQWLPQYQSTPEATNA